jgi:polyribonucleotide nucleotidyltransferase
VEKNKLESQSVEFAYGNKTVKLETHKVARQTTGAVLVTIDDLVVLTTVVARKEADPKKRLLPFSSFLSRKILCYRIYPRRILQKRSSSNRKRNINFKVNRSSCKTFISRRI